MSRGQALLDSMVLFCASVGMVAVLSPAYMAAYGLSEDSRNLALSRAAAQRVSQAVSLAGAMGEGTEISGEAYLPEGANITIADAIDGNEAFVLVRKSTGETESFLLAKNCDVSGSCIGSCSFKAYYRGSCHLEFGPIETTESAG